MAIIKKSNEILPGLSVVIRDTSYRRKRMKEKFTYIQFTANLKSIVQIMFNVSVIYRYVCRFLCIFFTYDKNKIVLILLEMNVRDSFYYLYFNNYIYLLYFIF